MASFRIIVGLSLCAFILGCGESDSGVEVTGKVTKGGKPLKGVSVSFMPVGDDKDARPASGETDENGEYRLSTKAGYGALPGKYKIVLTDGGGDADIGALDENDVGDPNAKTPAATYAPQVNVDIPKEYQSEDTSPKEVEVTRGGDNAFNIDL